MPTPPSNTEQSPRLHMAQNVTLFIISIACLVGGIYAFSFVMEYTAAALAGGLVLIVLSFFIPLQLSALFDRRASATQKASAQNPSAEHQLQHQLVP